ncbi:hypothetical protein SLEP1_g23496 [Rubroshorea leprosula]|uniref:Uncharacterized protein n=1 Tax=Rubroshorea leprosula TaxID=152421 RepID=A0AAV5JMY7_9ROSI|nr:hypothetical protein SLEP1_g23496 [Rubroshorea leprosula]
MLTSIWVELLDTRHSVKYEDGDQEDLVLSNENIKFCISLEEMGCLNLSCNVNSDDNDGYHYDEMVVLAASLDDCKDLSPGISYGLNSLVCVKSTYLLS